MLPTSAFVRRLRGSPRAAHEQRNLRGRIVREHLAERDSVLALHVAVVGGEEDVGLVQLAGAPELTDDPGHGFVHGQQ